MARYMYTEIVKHCSSCPQCAIVNGTGRVYRPPLHPIPVQRPSQIIGVDAMDLSVTTSCGSLSGLPYQVATSLSSTSHQISKTLVIPWFGVLEALLSDRGTNLLSHLMLDVCNALGMRKLNTTAYHSQCDGMVERFNHTLKITLCKHAATFGCQWDRYL